MLGVPQTDPSQPGYDPIATQQIKGPRDVRFLFEEEPRDDAWASQREADITSFVGPELQVDARIEVECRTATCRIRLVAPWATAGGATGDYPIVCLARRTAPMWGSSRDATPDAEDPYPAYFLVFDQATREQGGFLARRGASCADFKEEWRRMAEQAHVPQPSRSGR